MLVEIRRIGDIIERRGLNQISLDYMDGFFEIWLERIECYDDLDEVVEMTTSPVHPRPREAAP